MRILAISILLLSGCLAEVIDYTASSPPDCCYFLPDGGGATECFVTFIPPGQCLELVCDAVDWQTGFLNDHGETCSQ